VTAVKLDMRVSVRIQAKVVPTRQAERVEITLELAMMAQPMVVMEEVLALLVAAPAVPVITAEAAQVLAAAVVVEQVMSTQHTLLADRPISMVQIQQ
jgi:hypothetical protein